MIESASGPTHPAPDRIMHINVLETIKEGTTVYEAGQ